MRIRPFNLSFFCSVIHKFLDQRVKHRCGGNGEQHTDDAEGGAHGHGDENPDPGESNRGAHHLGIDQIALDLLKNDDEKNEPERLRGAIQQDQKRAQRRADQRAENGNEGGKADDHRDQEGVGHTENEHTDKAENPKDHGFRDLSRDESGEGRVHQSCQRDDPIGVLGRKQSRQQ